MQAILEEQGISHVLEFEPPPVEVREGDIEIDQAMSLVNMVIMDILRLSKEGYGSYLEIAYEWTYQEAVEVLEILEIVDEKSEIKRRQEEIASRHR